MTETSGEQPKGNRPKEKSRREILKKLVDIVALPFVAKGLNTGDTSSDSRWVKIERVAPQPTLEPKIEKPFTSQKVKELIFHDLRPDQQVAADNIVQRQKQNAILANPSYSQMIDVVKKNMPYIKAAADTYNIPVLAACGVVLIENGGGDALSSPVGARGPAQLMPETARRFGLIVNENRDDRIDPAKCFKAQCEYLATMREMFGGDLGIAIWGYHAGEGNVYSALRQYFYDTEGEDYGSAVSRDPQEAQTAAKKYRELIKSRKLNIHTLLQNPRVIAKVIDKLQDETQLYVFKAVAGAELVEKETE